MKSYKITTLLAFLFAVVGSSLLAGCNTMNGVGKDVERAGEKIQSNAK